MIYKLYKDELYKNWLRHTYEIEANSKFEAAMKILDDNIDPVESEWVSIDSFPDTIEISDDDKLIFRKN